MKAKTWSIFSLLHPIAQAQKNFQQIFTERNQYFILYKLYNFMVNKCNPKTLIPENVPSRKLLGILSSRHEVYLFCG